MNFLRNSVFPLFLIVTAPPFAIIVWYTNTQLSGSLLQLGQLFMINGFFSTLYQIWAPVFFGSSTAWSMIAIFMVFQLALMRWVPGKKAYGPITPKGNIPVYKANGLSAFCITISAFLICSYGLKFFPASIIYNNFGEIIGALNCFSLLFCVFLCLKGHFAPSSKDASSSGNFIFDYYWGTELYPRLFGFDIKQFTNCRFGMMSWPVIIISFAAKQGAMTGLSNSIWIAVAIMLVYIAKFFIWEMGYMRSLDIMHDRAGYYICWGCLVWVPVIYTSPILYLVNHPVNFSALSAFLILTTGLTCVLINYWADRQRQAVRTTNGECTVWGKKPVLIRAEYQTEQGERKENLLLVSGWWGVSRHFHYLPEIAAAFLWTLPALFTNALPWFYVVFLTILLVHRSLRDEERCQKKYGAYWQEYCEQVPNRIIPIFLTRGLRNVFTSRSSST